MTAKDFRENIITLFITIISLIILFISVIFSLNNNFTESELSEIENSAKKLITANFDTATYFGVASLKPTANYNAKDYHEGTVPCSTEIFSSYKELSAFINDTYVPNTAAVILNSELNGTKRYSEINGQLCMAVVVPNIDYPYDWSTYKMKLTNVKKNSADITVTMNFKAGIDTQKYSGTNTFKLKMIKQNGKWLLDNFVY